MQRQDRRRRRPAGDIRTLRWRVKHRIWPAAAGAVFDALVLFKPDAAPDILTAEDSRQGEVAAITAPEASAKALARHKG